MRPEAFNARINELLDRRARPEDDEQLRAFAAESSLYRDALAAQQRLFEGIEADEIPELPADFAQRVVAQAMQGESAPGESQVAEVAAPRAARRSWMFELAAVAALALVTIAGWSALDQSTGGGVSTAAKPNQPAISPDVPVVAEHETAPVNLNDESLSAPQIAVTPLPSGARYDELYRAILNRLPDRTAQDELLARRPEWVDEVAIGLRPVATSLGGAINTLRSTLPPSSKSDREEKPQAGVESSPAGHLV
jgi:hypothetical protein